MLGLTDPYTAYCLDEACSMWANVVNHLVDNAPDPNAKPDAKNRQRQQALEAMLRDPSKPAERPQNGQTKAQTPPGGARRFKDPGAALGG